MMRKYLIDTGPLAALLHDRSEVVQLIQPWMLEHEAATSALVYAEIIEYISPGAEFEARHQALRTILREILPYFPTYPILRRYADIRLRLRPPYGHGLIGDIDTLIAATALERNLTVVTLDRDFLRVPDLGVILLDRSTFTIAEQRSSAE